MSRFLLRRGNDVVCLVILATMAVCLSGMQLKAQPAAQFSNPAITVELTVSRNPHYFQDAKGAPLILNGAQSWNTLQDYGTDGSVQPLDFDAFVKFLTGHGHNFTLLWTLGMPKFCNLPTTENSPPDFTVSPVLQFLIMRA